MKKPFSPKDWRAFFVWQAAFSPTVLWAKRVLRNEEEQVIALRLRNKVEQELMTTRPRSYGDKA